MTVVKKGTNGWTCMVHGGVPMCVDDVGLDWVHSLMSKSTPPEKVGLIYMLKGDAGVSNTDPFAKSETPDNNWVKTGPHIMIVGGVKGLAQGLPNGPKPDETAPYVMWPGTPYEHLMLPTEWAVRAAGPQPAALGCPRPSPLTCYQVVGRRAK